MDFESVLQDMHVLDKADITYLDNILLKNGTLQVVPYDDLKDIPQTHLSQFCVEKGYYCLPTTELVEFLLEKIGPDKEKTIEIGSGSGSLCKALGIKGTDNYMQTMPKYANQYKMIRQATVLYGQNVERLDALSAVQKYKPKTVIAAWVTHKYNPGRDALGGNELGVNENKLLRKVKTYIHIGNENVHAKKPIMDIEHETFKAPWLVSRSMDKDKNVIHIWS